MSILNIASKCEEFLGGRLYSRGLMSIAIIKTSDSRDHQSILLPVVLQVSLLWWGSPWAMSKCYASWSGSFSS